MPAPWWMAVHLLPNILFCETLSPSSSVPARRVSTALKACPAGSLSAPPSHCLSRLAICLRPPNQVDLANHAGVVHLSVTPAVEAPMGDLVVEYRGRTL